MNPIQRLLAISEFQQEWSIGQPENGTAEMELYPYSAWQEAVANANTWLGYWEWAYERYQVEREHDRKLDQRERDEALMGDEHDD